MRQQPVRIITVCAASLVAAVLLLQDDRAVSAPQSDDALSLDSQRSQTHFREGQRTGALRGHFKRFGGRFAFFTDDGRHRFGTLENLNLQRVVRVVTETPRTLHWNVSGVVTEYRGSNFLLLSRATLLTRGGQLDGPGEPAGSGTRAGASSR